MFHHKKYADYSSIEFPAEIDAREVLQKMDAQKSPLPNHGWKKGLSLLGVLASMVVVFLCGNTWDTSDLASAFYLPPIIKQHIGHHAQKKATKALKILDKQIQGDISFKGDSDFCEAADIWQQGLRPPLAVIEVDNEADVQLALPALAHIYEKWGVPFRVKSGGHSYAGYSTVEDGIVLSLQRMKGLEFDHQTGIATVQPAVRVMDLLDQILVQHGHGGVTGECSGVAEAGFVLGGGYGFLARKYGLGADNMLSAHVVLADGTVVMSSPEENQDLFWALQGAGQNSFGIVTQFNYQLHPSQDQQLLASGQVPIDPTLMTEIGKTYLSAPGEFEFLLEGTVDEKGMTDTIISWFDSTDAGLEIGREYISGVVLPLLPETVANNISMDRISWSEMTREGGNLDGNYVRAWTGFLFEENNNVETWTKMIHHINKVCIGNPYLLVDIELWGGAIADIEPTDTAFYYRKAVYNVGLILLVPTDVKHAQHIYYDTIAQVDQAWEHVAQYLEGTYPNYIVESLKHKDAQKAYWGGNVDRLQAIKETYDRKNVLHHPQSIAPSKA